MFCIEEKIYIVGLSETESHERRRGSSKLDASK